MRVNEIIQADFLKHLLEALVGVFSYFPISYSLLCVRRLYQVQSDSEGLSGWPHILIPCQFTPTTFPFLHAEICITAIATIASISPRKEEMEDLGSDLT